ncbi:MAG: DUF1801 domain-containing protein [Gemmatimonadetes bacterium]|nr:DUF1801 domain-containing protein [Gemmatimonadota bacterium]
MAAITTVAEYLDETPPKARKLLQQIRRAVHRAVPGVTERISYRIPTFDLDGKYLIYMAAFKEHVSVYPVTKGMEERHGKAIAPYRSGRGTLRFPLDRPLPIALVTALVKQRVLERRGTPKKSR